MAPGGSQIHDHVHKRKHHHKNKASAKKPTEVDPMVDGESPIIEESDSSHRRPSLGATEPTPPSQPATIKTNGITCIGDYMITEQVLGVGSFGVVRLGFRLGGGRAGSLSPRRGSGDENFCLQREKVAIKIVSREDPKRIEALYKEIELLQQVGNYHPGIVHLHEVYEDESNLYLIFQYKSCDLYAYMEKHGRLHEEVAMRIFDQLVDAVSYLHENGVAHRDIKLENILLDEETLEVALADFGFATRYVAAERLNKWCGSPYTVSPEIIAHIPYDPEKVDVWALGSVLYTMLCGQFPFQAETINDVLRKTKAFRMNKFHTDVGYSSRDLIKSMMNFSTDKRMSISRCRQHPWMRFAAVARSRTTVCLDSPASTALEMSWSHQPTAIGESKSSGEKKSPR